MTYEERVARGAAWLDEVEPGWFLKIDLDTLSIADCDRCICGQLFTYQDEKPGYGYHRVNSNWLKDEKLSDYGFTAPLGPKLDWVWASLTDAWLKLIIQRRHEHAQQQQQLTYDPAQIQELVELQEMMLV